MKRKKPLSRISARTAPKPREGGRRFLHPPKPLVLLAILLAATLLTLPTLRAQTPAVLVAPEPGVGGSACPPLAAADSSFVIRHSSNDARPEKIDPDKKI